MATAFIVLSLSIVPCVIADYLDGVELEQKIDPMCYRCGHRHPLGQCPLDKSVAPGNKGPVVIPEPQKPKSQYCPKCHRYYAPDIFNTEAHPCVAREHQEKRNIEGEKIVKKLNDAICKYCDTAQKLQEIYDDSAMLQNRYANLRDEEILYLNESAELTDTAASLKSVNDGVESRIVEVKKAISTKQADIWPKAEELRKKGRIPGPAKYLGPPGFIRPNTAAISYLRPDGSLAPITTPRRSIELKSDKQLEKKRTNTIVALKAPSTLLALKNSKGHYSKKDISAFSDLVAERRKKVDKLKVIADTTLLSNVNLSSSCSRLRSRLADLREAIIEKHSRNNDAEDRGIELVASLYVDSAKLALLDLVESNLDSVRSSSRLSLSGKTRDMAEQVARYSGLAAAMGTLDIGNTLHSYVDPGQRFEEAFKQIRVMIADHCSGMSSEEAEEIVRRGSTTLGKDFQKKAVSVMPGLGKALGFSLNN